MAVLAGIVVILIIAGIVFSLWTMCVAGGREDDQIEKLAEKMFGNNKDSDMHA